MGRGIEGDDIDLFFAPQDIGNHRKRSTMCMGYCTIEGEQRLFCCGFADPYLLEPETPQLVYFLRLDIAAPILLWLTSPCADNAA